MLVKQSLDSRPFTTSLVYQVITTPITHDVAMGGIISREKVIVHAQYLDLVSSQYATLYYLIPCSPQLLNNPTPFLSIESHVVDGVNGSINQ